MLFDDPQAPVDGLALQKPGELRRHCQYVRRVLASQAKHGDAGTGFRRVGTDVGRRLSKFDRKILVELELHTPESSRHRQDTLARQFGSEVVENY